jgi:hypothetical protein
MPTPSPAELLPRRSRFNRRHYLVGATKVGDFLDEIPPRGGCEVSSRNRESERPMPWGVRSIRGVLVRLRGDQIFAVRFVESGDGIIAPRQGLGERASGRDDCASLVKLESDSFSFFPRSSLPCFFFERSRGSGRLRCERQRDQRPSWALVPSFFSPLRCAAWSVHHPENKKGTGAWR